MDGRKHSNEIEAELAAVADGTLPAADAERVLREAGASPELARRLERQRSAVQAVRALDARAPDALRQTVASAAAAAGGRARSRLRLPGRRSGRRPLGAPVAMGAASRRRLPAGRALVAAGGALATVTAAALVVVLATGGGTSAPTVQQAAPVALREASAPAPAALPGGHELAAEVGGIAYPTWVRIGWHAVGQRSDTIGGHAVRTVFYADAHGARIGYAIAAGDALPVSGGHLVSAHGAHVRLLTLNGAQVVTWRRNGHTCIIAARGVSPARLVALASYET